MRQYKEAQRCSWHRQEAVATSDSEGSTLDISLPTLLLESEVIYSRSALEAIGNILRQQMTAHTVSAFGGPVPLDVPFYRTYIRDTLACLKETMVQDFQYFHTSPYANKPPNARINRRAPAIIDKRQADCESG